MESVRLYSLLSGFSRALGLVCKKLTEHNLRVAYLAQVLAGHCGLDHQERKYLLIASMLHEIGTIPLKDGLANFVFEKEVFAIPIDDHTRHDFSHTAILAKHLKSQFITPKYNCLKATNIVKYAGKDLEFRQKNPRHFKLINISNQMTILCDDLITTGATIKQAKKALEKKNNEVLFSLTLADAKL